MLEIYLVRHGKTVFNTIGRIQGWSDSPLTAEGCAVAERLGRGLAQQHIRFDGVFSSTAPRAYETAQIILQHSQHGHLSIKQLPDLREYCFGGFEGEYATVLHQKIAEDLGFADRQSFLKAYQHASSHILAEAVSRLDEFQLAETEQQFCQRLRNAMNEVATQSVQHQRVLVVAHGMAITTILKNIDFASIGYRTVENASVSRLRVADGIWQIDSVGETRFLAD